MKLSNLLLLVIFSLTTCYTIYAGQTDSSKYVCKYQTTAHSLIQLEEKYSNLPTEEKRNYYDNMYSIVDKLIDSAKIRLHPFLNPNLRIEENKAQTILKTIDSLLTEQYFVVCIKVEKLSDALSPRKLNEFSCYKYLYGYRSLFCQKNPNAKYYGIDCDLGAILYVSIGEVLNFPIHMVEVTGHNFARWRFSDNSYMNFDNNTGKVYTDDDFRLGQTATMSTGFTPGEEIGCHYLTDMNREQVTAYYMSTIAITLSQNERYAESENLYKEAIRIRSYDALAMNNLSWMYLTLAQYNNHNYYNEAYRLSEKVDKILPSSIEYRDTYSCACAGVGKFKKAVEVEKLARNKPDRIEGYNKGMTCLELGEKLW